MMPSSFRSLRGNITLDLTEIKITGEYYRQLGARASVNEYGVCFCTDEIVVRLIGVMIVQLCECTKNH